MHEGLCGQKQACAGPGELDSRSSPGLEHTAWLPGRSPTRPALVSKCNIVTLMQAKCRQWTGQVCQDLTKPMFSRRTHLDIMQDNASASLVLEGQEFLSVLPLLVAVLLEEMREAIEGHVIPGEVESLKGEKHSY